MAPQHLRSRLCPAPPQVSLHQLKLRDQSEVSVASALAPVDVKDFPGHEAGRLEVEDRIDDVGDLAYVVDRVKTPEGLIGLDRMHRRFDDAKRDRIHADAATSVFDGERLGRRVESPFRERRKHGGHGGHCVIDEASGDLDDVAAAPLLHLGHGELRDMEKPSGIDAQDSREVGLGVLRERLADEDAGVVDECVDAPERSMPWETARCAVFRSAMSPGTTRMSGSFDGLTDRAVATTR